MLARSVSCQGGFASRDFTWPEDPAVRPERLELIFLNTLQTKQNPLDTLKSHENTVESA